MWRICPLPVPSHGPHGPRSIAKKSGRTRGRLTERFREGTERVHGPQQDRFARSGKPQGEVPAEPVGQFGLGEVGHPVIPAKAGMTNTGQFAVSRSAVITADTPLALNRASVKVWSRSDLPSSGAPCQTRSRLEREMRREPMLVCLVSKLWPTLKARHSNSATRYYRHEAYGSYIRSRSGESRAPRFIESIYRSHRSLQRISGSR